MKMTSAQAAKLLRQLNDELYTLRTREKNSKLFCAAIGENPEEVRPSYDYTAMQEQQNAIEMKIRKVKHALNVFNSTYVIEELQMTIDELLIYIPQLSNRCGKLAKMKDILPKERVNIGYGGGLIIDYRYANYDVEEASKDYTEASRELSKAQTTLDYANSTVEFEIDVEI